MKALWYVDVDSDICRGAEKLTPLEVVAEIETLTAQRDAAVKALRGVLHHDEGVKAQYRLPQSLLRHINAALASVNGGDHAD